jgi:peptide deformylase
MSVLEIRVLGDPVLRKEAEDVTEFGEPAQKLVDDLMETMLHSDDGIGLAAPQVGISKRALVIGFPIDGDMENRKLVALLNPEILEESEEVEAMEEGCLSLPGIQAEVDRPIWIKFRYQDVEGNELIAEAEDYFARVVQHEMDHLDGVVITDHLPALKRSLIRGKIKSLEKEGLAKARKLEKA